MTWQAVSARLWLAVRLNQAPTQGYRHFVGARQGLTLVHLTLT